MLAFLKLLLAPLRIFGRLLRWLTGGARGAGKAAKALGGAGGEALANAAGRGGAVTSRRRGGIERLIFKELARPRLVERDAADMTLEEADHLVGQSRHFYRYDFNLFAQGNFFYEEVEETYLNEALSLKSGGIDERFIRVMTDFRKAVNDNTRALLVYYLPALAALGGLAAWALLETGFTPAALEAPALALADFTPEGLALPVLVYAAAALIVWFLAAMLYSWPFKVTQQRNILNLDNYITSKFGRINQNFQVAKRRALNVERDKRMAQREELKAEAGTWTLAYHWLAMRLLLCELTIRNKVYQIRRNTLLYWFAGAALTAALAGGAAVLARAPAPGIAIGVIGLVVFGGIVPNSFQTVLDVLEANEWSRFHHIDLDATIAEHVGEDKVQIVTFRDRNRFE